MLRRLAAIPLAEAHEYSKKLYAATKDIAPSLIRYTVATDYDRLTRRNLKEWQRSLQRNIIKRRFLKNLPTYICFCLRRMPISKPPPLCFFPHPVGVTKQCLKLACGLAPGEKKELLKTTFEHIQSHDAALRELENIDLQFEFDRECQLLCAIKETPDGDHHYPGL